MGPRIRVSVTSYFYGLVSVVSVELGESEVFELKV
jgi:hypothetical protein